jgi:signal transduction histidine kinase
MSFRTGGRFAAAAESSAIRAEAVLARTMVLLRVCGIALIGFALALDWSHYRSRVLVLALVGAVVAESATLVVAIWKRGLIKRWWVAADVAFLVVCLVAGAELSVSADGHSWVYFVYPFTVVTCYEVGVAFHRQRAVISATTVLAAGYALSALTIHHDPPLNVLPNALTYYAAIPVAWAAAEFRRSGHATDASRATAIAQAADLARERERARHARMLHDRVLQTLEALTRHRSVLADAELCSHIAAEAGWLRALVEGTPMSEPGDLLSRLQELAAQRTAAGLRIEFNNALLRSADLRWRPTPEAADALVDATAEALTNVSKHSGTKSAVVRAAATPDLITVTVLDHGHGFDPAATRWGIGLEKSITARIEEVGGSVLIESSPGVGTYIELTVPAAARPAVRESPGRT